MAWEDFLLTEYVHRKSREKDGKLEYIEVVKIYKNEELTSIKLVIGDENTKKDLEMTVNEWKSLLIFFNTIKTRTEPAIQVPKPIIKSNELIEEPVEANVPVMPTPLVKEIESLTGTPSEFKQQDINLPGEERVIEPSLSISQIVDSIDEKIEPKPEQVELPSPEIDTPEKGIDKIKDMVDQIDKKPPISTKIQKELDSQLKTAEKEAANIIEALDSDKATLSPEMLDFNRAIAEKSQKIKEIKEEKKESSTDLAKSMKIMGFHEPEIEEKIPAKDIKIQLPTLKAMPEHPPKVKPETSSESIDAKAMVEIEELFSDLKEKTSVEKEPAEEIIDLEVKETALPPQDVSEEIIKKAISIQNELDMNDEAKSEKLKNAMEEVASVMPDGPARDFVNYMLEKRKINLEKKSQPAAEQVKPKPELDEIEEEKELPKAVKEESKIKKEPELIVEDVPSIWELMEEKEKIDEELKAQINEENEKLSFTIAVSSENESEKAKAKEKKLRFW